MQDDFSYAALVKASGLVFDSCYELMSPEERRALKKSLHDRIKDFYAYFCNRLENRVMDNHAWQHTFMYFTESCLAAKGDIPEADKYLAYCHDVWLARHPVLSSTDGGWNNGSYYGANLQCWFNLPLQFKKYTGYNYYRHPWHRNHAWWHLFRQPPGSTGDGFGGDGYERDSRGMGSRTALWLAILDAELDIPLARWLAGKDEQKKKIKIGDIWLRMSEGYPLSSPNKAGPAPKTGQSRFFQDIGIVNMNRDILNTGKNLMVSLRSGPWGGFGHNLASHNAFNIVFQGEPLFVPFRYRHGGSKHSLACYRHTRGHNSVLIDDKGQPYSSEAYGWIPRYLHGNMITYACGDASNAYDGTPSPQWHKRVIEAGLSWEKNMGHKGMKRFRRHLLFLRPSLIVVYDELEAKQNVRWDWLLHCRKNMKARGTLLRVEGMKASALLRASQVLKVDIRTEPLHKPFNVDRRGGKNPEVYKPRGSFAYFTPEKRCRALRVIVIIQVGEDHAVRGLNKSIMECGEWKISAEMDPARPAGLLIRNKKNTAWFVLKKPGTGESVIEERIKGRRKVFSTVDELPYAARGLEHHTGK
jgi:hypothetical protein